MDFYSEVGLVECTEEFYARQLQHLPKLCHYPAINGERRLSLCITINTRHTCTILMLVSIARQGIEQGLPVVSQQRVEAEVEEAGARSTWHSASFRAS